jgi:undecaprenyl phosphate-alpha-L-ara4FN deformylase
VRTLLYGTLIPGPDIGRRCADVMRSVRDEGFEVGVHCWDHVRWQDFVARRDADWTRREMDLACERFAQVFQTAAKTWGAAGWQTNVHAARYQERFEYASDTRGSRPFQPVWNGQAIGCPQVPTTLPTLDELVGRERDVVQHLLGLTRAGGRDQVFTAHAELEGGKLAALFDALLAGWRSQGYALVATREIAREALPRHEVIYGEVPGRSGTLALQGKEVTA